ncbi:cysteine proteinase inhibitor A-like [Nymphaea colorata]|nr:cysteine proteinase inhibitor A-like [Nymphaea colorata]
MVPMWKGKWLQFLLKMVVLTYLMLLVFHPDTTTAMDTPGGISDSGSDGDDPTHDVEIIQLAIFAVEQFCQQTPAAPIKFSRVVSARTQVVEGIIYYLVIEAVDNKGEIEQFEAMIWVKPWENFRQIVEFKQI